MDGIVYLSARHQSPADLQQLLFEAFYESDEICKPTEAEIRRGLQDKQALILLDDVHLAQDELEQVLDIAPRSAFVVATRERCLWGEVRSLRSERPARRRMPCCFWSERSSARSTSRSDRPQ